MSGNASSLVNIFANKMQALQVSRTQRVTVALSGGPDSLALALLAAWWGNTTGRPPSEDVKIALEQTAFASHHINMRHEEQEQFPNNLVNNVRSFMRPGGRVQLGRAKDSDRPAPLRKGITQEMMDDPQRRPVDITALIVDHALRDESSQEAERAVELANALGLQPMMMRVDWRRKHPKQGQMLEAARNARYELMLDACRRLGARTLLTAHHAGDQVENFLIRLSRASGVDGLATIPEMATMTTANGNYKVRVLRPLLGIHKEQLLELCSANEVQWVEDPTNKNLSFTRNFIRDLLEQHGSYETMSAETPWDVAEEAGSQPEPTPSPPPVPKKPPTLAEQAMLSQYPTKDKPTALMEAEAGSETSASDSGTHQADLSNATTAAAADDGGEVPPMEAVEGADATTTADAVSLNVGEEGRQEAGSRGTDATVMPGDSADTARPITEEHNPLTSVAGASNATLDAAAPAPGLPTYIPKVKGVGQAAPAAQRQEPPPPQKRRSNLTLADHLAGVLAPTEVAGRRQEASLGRLDLEFETSSPRSKQPEIFGAQEGAVPCVLDDVLRLQGSCTDARNEFGERAAAVLREAVVSGRGNIAHLPVLQINGCLVDVAPIAATDPGTAQRAIGAILQAIAGRPYPPNLRSTRGLWNIIKSGNMRGSFQGGGCHAREVPIPGAARTTLMWVAPISSS